MTSFNIFSMKGYFDLVINDVQNFIFYILAVVFQNSKNTQLFLREYWLICSSLLVLRIPSISCSHVFIHLSISVEIASTAASTSFDSNFLFSVKHSTIVSSTISAMSIVWVLVNGIFYDGTLVMLPTTLHCT